MHKRLAFAAAAALAMTSATAFAQAPKPASPPSASPPAASPTTASPATQAAATPPASTPAPPAATEAEDEAEPAPSTSASTAASASASGSNASVTTGMSVKDSSGATIGSITDVKTDAAGKKTATIKMGADTFAVDTASLAVAGGAATVNASQAEIKKMLKK